MAEQQIESLGRYKLQRVLGKGAMGVVYEGLDPRLNRKVAIKTILVGNLDEATARDYSKRFAREAQAVARLNHPNIVQVYDFGEEGEIAYIVMEYVRGKELKSSFDASERFEIGTAIRLMTELLGAMDFAHNAGVIHRDIKPANVMVDIEGHAKLADFGVARISDPESQTGATQAGTMVGTPAYMSPEQIQGQKIDRRTDIFSAGVILYQFLTGQKPFQGGGAWTMAKKIVHDDPPAPSSLFATVSPGYDRVVARALAKHPDKRYQSAQEFSNALQRVLDGRSPENLEEASPELRIDDDPTVAPVTSEDEQRGSEVELEFWHAIKDTDDPEELELYLEEFPQGTFLELAQNKLAALRHPGGQAGFDADQARAKQADQERAQREAAARAKLEAEEQAHRAAEARARQEAEEKARKIAAEQARRAAEEKARLEAERLAQLEAQAKAKREAEEQARREAVAKAKREADEKARREAEARARREAEARAKREAEEKARREAEEKARREAEARAKREAEEKARREAEAKAKREVEEKARREAEEKARRIAEEKSRREAEEKARLEAEAKAKREAEVKARREAEEKARREAEEEARRIAEEKARRKAEEKAHLEAVAKAKREAEEKARREAEEKARREAEARAKREAEEKARREAEEQARREAEEQARREAEAKASRIAEEKARREAEIRAKLEADARARRESQQRAMREAERKAIRAAEVATRREAREQAERDAEEAAAREAREAARLEQEAWEKRVAAEKAKLAAETAAKRAAREKVQREHDERVKLEVEGLLKQQKAPAGPAPAVVLPASKSPKFLSALLGKLAAEKPPTPADLYEKALALERSGQVPEAVNLLKQAANANNGAAARRLGEIYANGAVNVPCDPKLSIRWFSVAEALGEKVSRAKGNT